ncbi:20146_t:CDS:2 [Funneliformis geosporum]|nr:20146_t:CDS:2 [Funneliformis geosporum]
MSVSLKFRSLFITFVICSTFLRVESFTPKGRLAHSSVLVEDKLYFFGGAGSGTNIELSQIAREIFYLDVSKPFDIKIPSWTELSNIPFGSIWATVVSNNINNDPNIYLFGGFMVDNDLVDSFSSIIHRFNVNSSTWNIPPVGGISPERRRETKAVNSDGKLYIFGGSSEKYLGSPTIKFFNDMNIFDTVGLSWLIISQVDAPRKRASYTATLLPNGFIVYIGGYEIKENGDITEVDIKQINLYDTNSLTWSLKMAKLSTMIENRSAHSAVLAPDGKIIIYGGSKSVGSIYNHRVVPDIAVLNTRIDPFEWSEPNVTSDVGTVPSLTAHTADLVGNYMIVAFGNITQSNLHPLEQKSSEIYLMDIRNFTWVNAFEIQNTIEHVPIKPNKNTAKPIIIVIATISAIIGTGILSIFGIFIYKWQRSRMECRENLLVIPGSESNNSHNKLPVAAEYKI